MAANEWDRQHGSPTLFKHILIKSCEDATTTHCEDVNNSVCDDDENETNI